MGKIYCLVTEFLVTETEISAQGAEEFSSSKSIRKSSYLLKCNHGFRFPLKTSSAMHLCKFLTVHCFKTDISFYFRSFYCERHYFELYLPLTNGTVVFRWPKANGVSSESKAFRARHEVPRERKRNNPPSHIFTKERAVWRDLGNRANPSCPGSYEEAIEPQGAEEFSSSKSIKKRLTSQNAIMHFVSHERPHLRCIYVNL